MGTRTLEPRTTADGVSATLASIADAVDATAPAGLDVLRRAAEAAHTIHATRGDAASPLSNAAAVVLRELHAATTGFATCPLDA